MDAKALIAAVSEVADNKGLSGEAVIQALELALEKAYIKVLGGSTPDLPDPVVKCVIDPDTGKIYLAQVKKVVEEVTDDFLEIDEEEANEGLKKAKYHVGDDYEIEADVEDLSKATAMGVKSYFRQGIAEAERTELYKIYKDHIGEMVTGTVEKADDRSVIVNIGRATVELNRKELIGDEYFKIGDPIKVYIQEVRSADEATSPYKKKGPQIEATRSSEGFLKRLFEEEIHEIYDGTVVIKAIARKAGVRAKVAVSSVNDDVDATGACIGQGGSRIQKIVSQLGNGHSKEKIDIIEWSEFTPKFIIESVRPVIALGVNVDEENKEAEVILSKEALENQLGRYRNNTALASALTGYKISFMTQQEAEENEVSYVSSEIADEEAKRIKAEREADEYRRKSIEDAKRREEEAAAKKEAEEAARKVAEEAARQAEEEAKKADKLARLEPLPENPVAPKAQVKPEEFPMEANNPAAAALAALKSAQEAAATAPAVEEKTEVVSEEKPAMEEVPASKPEETREVKTTTTLSDLEAELESAKGRSTGAKVNAKTKRPRKISDDEVKHEAAPKSPVEQGMAVYTEEELKAIEAEDETAQLYDDGEDDVDYDDYDQYYDDEGK